MTLVASIVLKWDLFKLYLYLGSKLLKYVRFYLFCLGDLYFHTVDVLEGGGGGGWKGDY